MSLRLDQALVAKGLARSRSHAAQLIKAGEVRVDGQVVTKASFPVTTQQLDAPTDDWVSRAAHKLLGAIEASQLTIPARVLDAGASTGGFTQVCLSRGAQRVYAVDVGHGQLHPSIASDPRVVVHEGLNLRDLHLDHLEGQPVDLIVCDVSFISVRLLIERFAEVLAPGGQAMIMVKPQFEVGRRALSSLGVVRDPRVRAEAIEAVVADGAAHGWSVDWRGDSEVAGENGNREHFLLFGAPAVCE